MGMREQIYLLEQEREKLLRGVESLKKELDLYRSGKALTAMREQRDLLWLFARQCSRWGADTCQCGHRAADALESAGLHWPSGDKEQVARIDPTLALRLELS
jgi:hypothetical protein